MFQLLKDSNIPFMGISVPAIGLSVIAMIFSIYMITVKGFNFGVDFAGGLEMVVSFPHSKNVQAEDIRESLASAGIDNATVQEFGTEIDDRPSEYIIHFSGDFADPEIVQGKLNTALGGTEEAPIIAHFRFSGLEKAYMRLSKEMNLEEVTKSLQAVDYDLLEFVGVSPFGREGSREYEIRFKSISTTLVENWSAEYSTATEKVEIQRADFVGAKVGKDLKINAILSILITMFLIFIYIFLRFDFVYSPGAIVALAHDLLLTAGLFSFLDVEFDLTTVAALLTIAGYTVNDTIVIYDRIREMKGTLKGKPFIEIVNIAINQTLSRTIITALTTLLATLTLLYFGGPVIHSFALTMTFGVIVGSYSTIFIASAMAVWIESFLTNRNQSSKKKAKAA